MEGVVAIGWSNADYKPIKLIINKKINLRDNFLYPCSLQFKNKCWKINYIDKKPKNQLQKLKFKIQNLTAYYKL